MHEYDLIADWYARDRRTIGLAEVQAFAATLPPGASVLDVGCGSGLPLTKFLVDSGFDVLGLDSSSRMLEKFHANLPQARAVCARIQDVDLSPVAFDAAIAWGVLFHLPLDQQVHAIGAVARGLRAGGRFLFTSGDPDETDWTPDGIEGAPMDGVPFHYWSFTREGYRKVMAEHSFTLLGIQKDAGGSTYYSAQKTSIDAAPDTAA